MRDALVSILIPCHNAAPWVGAALRSALAQTWPRTEIIVVDDDSTDGSGEILRRFESPHCRIVPQTRCGAGAARNRALAHARGDYIQYLDADDLLAPDKVERQMESAAPGVLSFGSITHFFDMPEKGELHPAWLPVAGAEPVSFLSDLWGGEGPEEMVQPGQWLVPRGLIEKAGPWNETLSVDDDGEFFARVILASERIMAVPEACCHYRKFRTQNNLSATGCRKSAMRAARFKSEYLLRRSQNASARYAVRRLVTREIVDAHPAFPDVVEEGMKFLREHNLALAERLEGSPWFLRLHPVIGWRAARRLQWHVARWRRRINVPAAD